MIADQHVCDDMCVCPEHQTPMHYWLGGAIQYGPNAADICRWEDCSFVTVPTSLDAFRE